MKEEFYLDSSTGCEKFFRYADSPVFHVSTVNLLSDRKDWVEKLSKGAVLVSLKKIGAEQEMLDEYEETISFLSYIEKEHVQSCLSINKTIHAPDRLKHGQEGSWEVRLRFSLNLQSGDKLEVTTMDKEYVVARVKDWKARIKNLFELVSDWCPSNTLAQEGKPVVMHENLMEQFEVKDTLLPTLDLFEAGVFKLSFKPKGLWVLGANGRIDILSTKMGSFFLIDKSESMKSPQWYLISSANPNQHEIWQEDVFLDLLKKT